MLPLRASVCRWYRAAYGRLIAACMQHFLCSALRLAKTRALGPVTTLGENMVAVIVAFSSLLHSIAWPIAATVIAVLFRTDIRSVLPRIRKAGPTGVELDPVQRQNIGKADLTLSATKQLPGLLRTKAIDDLERLLRQNLSDVPEEDRLDWLLVQLAQTRLIAHFERVYRAIFGTQITLLRRLNEQSTITVGDARQFYSENAAKYTEIYDTYGFDGWITFLMNESLIMQREDKLDILPVGRDFLLYTTVKGMTELKPY